MSLVAKLSALATRIGAEIKGLVHPSHPGLARAWVSFGFNGSAMQVASSYNVATVTRLAAGRYRVTFATPFANANYCWVATCRSNTASGNLRFAAARSTTDGKTTSQLELVCTTSTASLADTTEVNLVVFG